MLKTYAQARLFCGIVNVGVWVLVALGIVVMDRVGWGSAWMWGGSILVGVLVQMIVAYWGGYYFPKKFGREIYKTYRAIVL